MNIFLIGGVGNQIFQLLSIHEMNKCSKSTVYISKNLRQELTCLFEFIAVYNPETFSVEEKQFGFFIQKFYNLSLRLSTYPKKNRFTLQNLFRRLLEKTAPLFFGEKVMIMNGINDVVVKKNYSNSALVIGYLQNYHSLSINHCNCGAKALILEYLTQKQMKIGNSRNFASTAMVHIRLGDYRNNSELFLQDMSYYEEAISELKNLIYVSAYHIYSNEFESMLELLKKISIKNVSFPVSENAVGMEVLREMTKYKIYIISNSTLSLLAACISDESSIVFAPKNWFRSDKEPSDFLPPSFIRL